MSKMAILPQVWGSDTHEVTRGLPPADAEFPFYHSFERLTRPTWRKGCSATAKICILPQFSVSDTSKVTKTSLGHVKNLHFTTKGSLRHVKNLRVTTVLSVRHARSDERVVKSTGAIPAPRQKKNIFSDFFRRFWLAVFLCNLFSNPFV